MFESSQQPEMGARLSKIKEEEVDEQECKEGATKSSDSGKSGDSGHKREKTPEYDVVVTKEGKVKPRWHKGFSKKKCEAMMKKADMNNLLPETLLRASDMEIEADLAELRAGIDHMQVEGGVDDVFQDLAEAANRNVPVFKKSNSLSSNRSNRSSTSSDNSSTSGVSSTSD